MSDLAGQVANKYGINPGIFKRLVQQESGGRQSAKSPAGAIGETQLLPSTAKSLGVNPYDTVGNLEGGAKYLRQQLDRFGGDYRKALAAYNAGPGAVEKYGGVPPFAETQAYVRNILSGGAPAASTPQSVTPQGSTTRTIPGVDNSAQRRALILQFLQRGGAGNPQAVQNLAVGLPGAQDTPGRTVQVVRHASTLSPAEQKGGVASFDGKPVAGWIAPILSYARQRGWKGTVTSGVRTDAQQTAIYRSGVRPAAVPMSMGGAGSNHERTGFLQGAVDVTDAPTLNRILQAKHSRLQWAGAKDPVHFSVPGPGGSY